MNTDFSKIPKIKNTNYALKYAAEHILGKRTVRWISTMPQKVINFKNWFNNAIKNAKQYIDNLFEEETIYNKPTIEVHDKSNKPVQKQIVKNNKNIVLADEFETDNEETSINENEKIPSWEEFSKQTFDQNIKNNPKIQKELLRGLSLLNESVKNEIEDKIDKGLLTPYKFTQTIIEILGRNIYNVADDLDSATDMLAILEGNLERLIGGFFKSIHFNENERNSLKEQLDEIQTSIITNINSSEKQSADSIITVFKIEDTKAFLLKDIPFDKQKTYIDIINTYKNKPFTVDVLRSFFNSLHEKISKEDYITQMSLKQNLNLMFDRSQGLQGMNEALAMLPSELQGKINSLRA